MGFFYIHFYKLVSKCFSFSSNLKCLMNDDCHKGQEYAILIRGYAKVQKGVSKA